MNSLNYLISLFLIVFLYSCNSAGEQAKQTKTQGKESIQVQNIKFESDGINLVGTIYTPSNPNAAIVLVHGSDQVPRMTKFAELLAKNNLAVLTYDKRGVGESGGIYAGPEVGTNNIDTTNLNLLAKDANAAVKVLNKKNPKLTIGLIGASQAGWIMPIAANKNNNIDFLVLFSSPVITTLEQLRFQFYTDGRKDFWENHTEAEAREHTFNDPDKYQFIDTDPKVELKELSIPSLWLFGGKDIQIPVKLCIEYLDEFKIQGKPFEYILFPSLGHNTTSPNIKEPVETAIKWIKRTTANIKKLEKNN